MGQKIFLEWPPSGRVGHRDPVRRTSFTLRDAIDDPTDHHRRQILGGVGLPTHENRRVITDPSLEFTDYPVRIGQRTPLSGLTNEHRTVCTQEEDRGHRWRPATQSYRFGLVLTLPPDGRRREACPDVDPQCVTHDPRPLDHGKSTEWRCVGFIGSQQRVVNRSRHDRQNVTLRNPIAIVALVIRTRDSLERGTMVRPQSAPDLPAPSAPPSALWIFRQIAGAPSAPLTAAIVGPGGTGKSVLLDALAREYQKADAVVVRGNSTAGLQLDTLDPNEPVLVDDAHHLDQATLAGLRTFAEGETARLVVAYRPWPRSRELSALGASLARRRSPVVVGHLDRGTVGARIAARVGCTPPDSLIDLVHEQSGGAAPLGQLAPPALQDTGRFDPRRPEQFRCPERVNVSAGLAERLRYQLEALDPEIYRLLQAMAVGAALDADVLGPLLDADPASLTDTVEAAMATGLVTNGGQLIPFIRNIVLRLMPMLRSRAMQRQLATIQLDRGGSVLAAGCQLLGTGASGSRVAAVLERAGDEALRQSPALAAELYAGTIDAGASPSELAARHAQAVALTGDLDQALRLADQVVSDPSAADRERGVSVVAAILAHRGLPAHSAQLYCSLPADVAGGAALAVPALIGIGELAQAGAVLDAADADQGATLMAGAEILMARGMLATVTGTSTGALSQLARATVLLEPAGETVLLPAPPAAPTALVALQCGELAVADSTLRRAVAAKLGGRPAHPRHLLLHGWLAVGLARRESDAAALSSAWRRARCVLVRHPIDLYSLQPLGELAVAAARLGERESVTPYLKEAEKLLEELGKP